MRAPSCGPRLRLGPAASIALLFLATDAGAQDRPLLTERADTAPQGTIVLEAGLDAMGSEPNFLTGSERDTWAFPVLRLVFSPADAVEIDLEWVGRVGARDDPDFGSISDWGDVTLRSKVRLLGGSQPDPTTLAARFAVTLPQTSFGEGLGPNTLRMSAQALLSGSAGPVRLHANAGLAIHDEPLRAHEQRDFLAYGVALEYPSRGSLAVSAEVSGLAGEGAPGADARSELRAGVRYSAGRWRLDGALRRGLAEADGDWGFTLGFASDLRRGR